MRHPTLKAIACTISRGGFSDERVFSIDIGEIKYSGVASRRHMWTAEGKPLEEGEPPLGKNLSGLVAARVIQVETDGRVLVSIPDGEVITMPADQLVDRPAGVGEHVPV